VRLRRIRLWYSVKQSSRHHHSGHPSQHRSQYRLVHSRRFHRKVLHPNRVERSPESDHLSKDNEK